MYYFEKYIYNLYMPSKSASKNPSKKRSAKRSSSSSKKARTQSFRPHPSKQLTHDPSPNLNVKEPAPKANANAVKANAPKANAPKANAVKAHSKQTWRDLLRGPSEGKLMMNRMAKIDRRYQHYLRSGEVKPLSP